MVGLVIVSHSKILAEGVVELAMQMADTQLLIIAAGGMENGEIGTDAVRISNAILKANRGEGVVVLADLGSAILSAQTALELLDAEIANQVRIADAPIVEGSISAAVQASIGGCMEEVLAAAEAARTITKL